VRTEQRLQIYLGPVLIYAANNCEYIIISLPNDPVNCDKSDDENISSPFWT
jgi:hypothetical protein